MPESLPDKSNGYEAIAPHFIRARNVHIGPRIVRAWAKGLQPGATVLDIGCGHGQPIAETLIQEGFEVFGVDASPTLVAAFRARFPGVTAECDAAEESRFFGKTFDAAIGWGLLFVLAAETQRVVIGRMAGALKQHGQLLFTAPREACTWKDSLTGLESVSLGREVYEKELAAHGLAVTGNDSDEGDNYYYFATKS